MSTTDNELKQIEKLQSLPGWQIWKFQVKVLLRAAEVMSIADGTRAKPVQAVNVTAEVFNKELSDF